MPEPIALDRQVSARLLLDLHHGRHVVEQLDRPAQVLQGVEVVRPVLGHELHVVEHPRQADQLHDRGPRTDEMGAQSGLIGIQQFP